MSKGAPSIQYSYFRCAIIDSKGTATVNFLTTPFPNCSKNKGFTIKTNQSNKKLCFKCNSKNYTVSPCPDLWRIRSKIPPVDA